ncbi:AraC family transcriptional regulator [Terrimonas sp. NA20]|uniref:AraC family transcriptional regulator n=1 Tax=Terrimonas ginsenosidimutans TaxID=2908004 RepID=A0ABS9KNQ0_9BACT|nr:AraC family transcriptional regulator [Terrimonas ginsenosidimutans]MCG2613936.1 AraC family transcriptional regulator [Terrimonas ginsenosidimutans]
MPPKNYLHPVDLTQPKYLQTLVENRRVFNLENCELNVFESYQETYRVPLTFNEFVITSMVRGKKVMHLFDQPSFEYLPGETVIVPANETMVIDFPEAQQDNPTQCIALAVDAAYVNNTLQYLNTYYNSDPNEARDWRLQFNQYHFANDTEVTDLINKLIRVCSSGEKGKNIFADLNLKELLIRLVQSQHLQQVAVESIDHTNQSRLHFVLHYIHEHLTDKIAVDALSRKAYLSRNMFFKWFKEQFGVTPLDYINRERIKLAKQLLADKRNNVSAVSMQCGFTDVNYFVRLFKKSEGITPGVYQAMLYANDSRMAAN